MDQARDLACPDLQQRLEDIGDQRRTWGPAGRGEQRAHVTLQVAPRTVREAQMAGTSVIHNYSISDERAWALEPRLAES